MTRQKKVAYFVGITLVILIGVIVGLVGYFYQTSNRLTTYRINTQVANIHVGGLFANEAQKEITDEALSWRKNADIQLVYQGYSIPLDSDVFSIDVRTTMRQIRDGRTIPLVVRLKTDQQNYLETVLSEHADTIKYTDFDLKRLEEDLLEKVAMLRTPIRIDLGKYIQNLPQKQLKIAESTLVGIDSEIFDTIDNFFGGRIEIEIEPKRFSLIDWGQAITLEKLEDPNATLLFTDRQLSMLGYGIYELILHTNFMDIQKHITKDPKLVPAYIYNRPGFETRIDTKNGLDFTFYNPNSMSYTVTITRVDNALSFTLYGAPFIDTIEVIGVEQVENIPYKVIVVYKKTYNDVPVEIGYPLTVQAGKEGKSVLIQRKITTHDGEIRILSMNEDIYQQIPKIMIYHPDDTVTEPII